MHDNKNKTTIGNIYHTLLKHTLKNSYPKELASSFNWNYFFRF